jgi:DNA-binding PadR family transcriptional regulator
LIREEGGMTDEERLRHVTSQMLVLLAAARDRAHGVTADDAHELRAESPYTGRVHTIGASAARASLKRMSDRGLVTVVGERPRRYRVTYEGRALLDAAGRAGRL